MTEKTCSSAVLCCWSLLTAFAILSQNAKQISLLHQLKMVGQLLCWFQNGERIVKWQWPGWCYLEAWTEKKENAKQGVFLESESIHQ